MQDIVKVYGASWCPDCRRAKRFLSDQRVPYEWHDIEVDPDGNLWIGAHPKLITFGRYASDPYEMAPAQVLKVSPGAGDASGVEEVYLDEGKALSGSSVAAPYKDRFLLGSVFDELFLDCRMFK